MGRLFDSACLLWKKTCGEEENCLNYDMDRYRCFIKIFSIPLCSMKSSNSMKLFFKITDTILVPRILAFTAVLYFIPDREYMHGVSISMMILAALLAILLNVLVARKVNREDEGTATLTDTGYVNEGMMNPVNDEDAISIRSWNTKFWFTLCSISVLDSKIKRAQLFVSPNAIWDKLIFNGRVKTKILCCR